MIEKYLSLLNEQTEFETESIMKDIWLKLTKEAMDKFNVYFDMENYDPINRGCQSYNVDRNKSTNRFLYQICKAGGDWQYPVIVFRCQLKDGYAENLSSYGKSGGCFVFIPSKDEGNYTLVKDSSGKKWCAIDNDFKKETMTDNNERDCIKALKNYLEKISKI
jgi:hypothetical protein